VKASPAVRWKRVPGASGYRNRGQVRHGGTSLFTRSILALSGGPSDRTAAARTGRVWVLLERNPPNRPLVPAGTPALRRESNSAPQNQKKELYALQKRSSRLANQARRHRPQLSVEPSPLGRIKAPVGENEERSRPEKDFQRDLRPDLRTAMDEGRSQKIADATMLDRSTWCSGSFSPRINQVDVTSQSGQAKRSRKFNPTESASEVQQSSFILSSFDG